MNKFFFYTSHEGSKIPVIMDEAGNYTFFNGDKPLRKFTDNLLHSLGKNHDKVLSRRLTEVNVCSLEELLSYLSTYNELECKLSKAENEVRRCKKDLADFLNPRLTYLETREMGCTDMVCWNYEFVINPKTGNAFFTPEDAKETFKKLMTKNAKEIAKMREDFEEEMAELRRQYARDGLRTPEWMDFNKEFSIDHYINENAPELDDFVNDEKEHPEWF